LGNNILHFAAVLGKNKRYDVKLDKKGKSSSDKQYEKDKLSPSTSKNICHCYMTEKEFYAIEFNVQHSMSLLPAGPLKVNTRFDQGEQFIHVNFADVYGYKRMQSVIYGKRLVIQSLNDYLHFRPVGDNPIDQGFTNRKLIRKVHEEYESLGIKSKDGPGYMSNYDEPFLRWIHGVFIHLTKDGRVKLRSAGGLKVCPNHKRTGRYASQYNAYYCYFCKNYFR
jgi:hypothetical protein